MLLVGLRRAEKRNAFDLAMLRGLAEAFTRYDDDAELRCAVLFGHGEHFTAGLDLGEVGPAVAGGEPLFPAGAVDPLGLFGRVRSKPVVVALQDYPAALRFLRHAQQSLSGQVSAFKII